MEFKKTMEQAMEDIEKKKDIKIAEESYFINKSLQKEDLKEIERVMNTRIIGYFEEEELFIGDNGKTFCAYKIKEQNKNILVWAKKNFRNLEDFNEEYKTQFKKVIETLKSRAVDQNKVNAAVDGMMVQAFCKKEDISELDFRKNVADVEKRALGFFKKEGKKEFIEYAKKEGIIGENGKVKLSSKVLNEDLVIIEVMKEVCGGKVETIFTDAHENTRYIVSKEQREGGSNEEDVFIVERNVGFRFPERKIGQSYYTPRGEKVKIGSILWDNNSQDWIISSGVWKNSEDALSKDDSSIFYKESEKGFIEYKSRNK